MTRSVDVRGLSSRTAELSEKMEGERRERERERENASHDFFFIAAAPLVVRSLRGRAALSLVGIAAGFRGQGISAGGGY